MAQFVHVFKMNQVADIASLLYGNSCVVKQRATLVAMKIAHVLKRMAVLIVIVTVMLKVLPRI